jgi:hypothetical protein
VKLGNTLSISRQYERMFVEEARVRVALSDLYNEIYLFLEKIRRSVTGSCEYSKPSHLVPSNALVPPSVANMSVGYHVPSPLVLAVPNGD